MKQYMPARIVTYCHEGRDLKDKTDNASRLAVLDCVANTLLAHPEWHPLDAVVFPGGFLSQVPQDAAWQFIAKLEKLSPGLQLVIGVDKDGEQLALAFNKYGLSGKARKIFPVDEDVDGKTMPPITLHESDFSDPSRIITLASGHKALLCVCYDMFGFSDAVRGATNRLDKAVLVEDHEGRLYQDKDGRNTLKRAFNAHQKMLAEEKPDIALATIHRFAAAGRDSFWQRHGIASASAALDKGMAIGAAHFGKLPQDSKHSTLAANQVSRTHLDQSSHRAAHSLQPVDEEVVHSGKQRGLLRLFKP